MMNLFVFTLASASTTANTGLMLAALSFLGALLYQLGRHGAG